MHWSIDRRMGVGFGLALLILVVTGVGQYLSTTQLVITSRGVAHSLEVTRVLESVRGDLEAVESDVHGYLLTGNRRFLDESRATASEVRYVFRQLRHLMTDDPAQRRRLDQLERLIAAKMSWIEQLVASYQRNGPRVAAALVRSDRGEDLMERTVRLIDVMAAEEAELLGVREEQARARAQTTLLVLLAGSVVAVALVGSALWMIRRDLAGRRRAEAALRHNEASLQAILDHTAVTIYLKDLDGRLLLVNRRFEELSQLPRSAIVGRLDSELFTGATLAVFRANDEDVLAATAPLSFERTVTIDDRLYTFLSIKSALRDEEGVPYAICVVSTDITERKHAEEEAQRLQLFLDSIIENIPNMIFVKDAQELRFVRLNRAGEALLGFGREELLGKSDYDFFPKEEADFFTGKDRQVLETGDPTDIPEESLATRDRGVRILHTKKVPIRDRHGTPQYLLGISEDITERKRAEEHIAALNEHLRQHAARLEEANRELDAFSYSVSHDLRAPVRHIDGFADLLHQHAGQTLDEKARRYLDLISDSAKSMGALIDDLLMFSRMGRAEMQRTTVDLRELVTQVRLSLAEEASGREIEWHVAPLPQVHGDPAMLRLVLTNLLANAVKYTRTRPSARIEIGATESEKETTVFVRDNGAGFDMEYSHKLFGVFQRLHRQDEFEGTGIGLANVRRIIHRHGGRTWAEGELGRGATFYFSLPRSEDEALETREAA